MLNRFSHRVIALLAQEGMISEDDSEVYFFGLEMLFQKILHYSTMLLLGFLFGMLLETILFMIFWGVLRIYAGGYHAKSKIACYGISCSIIPLIIILLKWVPWPNWTALLVCIVSIGIILRFAPVGNENKPLDEIEKVVYRRKTVILLILESCVALIAAWFQIGILLPVIALSMATAAVMLLMSKMQELGQKRRSC